MIHQDPNLRGFWKTDSKGNYLQWIPHPVEPPAKARRFWRRFAIDLIGTAIMVSVGATILFYALELLAK